MSSWSPGYATVGAVIAARSRNRIGWLFLAFGLAAALLTFANPYFIRGTVITPGSLPAAAAILGSLGSVLWPSTYLFLGLLLLLFPDGRLPSTRWRPVALVYVTSWVLLMLNAVVERATGSVHGVRHTNPLAIQALGHSTWTAVIQGIVAVAVAGLAVVALAPLVRFRRAGPVQRQQLKWFAFVVGGCIACVLAAAAIGPVLPVLPAVASWLIAVASAGVVVGLPIAVGLAILRYRLYDIDRLISRALVYASLTVILGLCYGGLVLALGQLFGRVGERTPSWAVTGATLAVAALFQPARRRMQAVVDRRFNRGKYNAAQTIQAFSTRLRDQVDLDTLSTELLAVVSQTMEPTQASLWLRPPPPDSPGTAPRAPRPTPWAY
jgi:hypothetical protein